MLCSRLLPTTTRAACQARAPNAGSACSPPRGFPQAPAPPIRLLTQMLAARARLHPISHNHPLRLKGTCPRRCQERMRRSSWLPTTTQNTEPQRLLLHGSLLVQQTRERHLGNPPELERLGISMVYKPSTPTGWAGALCRCSGLHRTKGASRTNRALLHTPGLPT